MGEGRSCFVVNYTVFKSSQHDKCVCHFSNTFEAIGKKRGKNQRVGV